MPKSNRNWLREADRALRKAEPKLEKGAVEPKDFYTLAAPIAANWRGVSEEALDDAQEQIAAKIAEFRDIEDTGEYLFDFYSSYIDAHVHFGYLDEMEADRILEYISINGDIFLYDDEPDA